MRKLVLLSAVIILLNAAAVYAEASAEEQWQRNAKEIEAYFYELAEIETGKVTWQVGEIAGSARAQHRIRIFGTAKDVQRIHTITMTKDTAGIKGDTLFGIQTHEYLHLFSSDEALTEFAAWLACMDMGKNYIGAFNHTEGMTYVYDADRYMEAYLKSGLSPREALWYFTQGTLQEFLTP